MVARSGEREELEKTILEGLVGESKEEKYPKRRW